MLGCQRWNSCSVHIMLLPHMHIETMKAGRWICDHRHHKSTHPHCEQIVGSASRVPAYIHERCHTSFLNACAAILFECLCRSARKCAGKQIDKIHALAFHEYRATHKTKSQVISLLHLVSIYGTHPELRPWLHASQSAVLLKYAQYLDRLMEKRNDFTKERNTSRLSIFNSLHFTPLLPAMQHIRQTYRASQLPSHAVGDDGVRPSMVNEINSLVRLFEEQIGDSPHTLALQ